MHFLITDTLSPAAQAILDAYMKGYGWLDGPCDKDGLGVAAVLRAAADQVVPEITTPWNSTLTPIISAQQVRIQLLAIADELEEQL